MKENKAYTCSVLGSAREADGYTTSIYLTFGMDYFYFMRLGGFGR
jgi:peroxiredoxin family protein